MVADHANGNGKNNNSGAIPLSAIFVIPAFVIPAIIADYDKIRISQKPADCLLNSAAIESCAAKRFAANPPPLVL